MRRRGHIILTLALVVAVVATLAVMAALAAAAPSQDSAQGQALFTQNCASCHGADGAGGKKIGDATSADVRWPALEMMYRPHGDPIALARRAILEGKDEEGDDLDAAMPRWQAKLTDAQVNDIISYLQTLGTLQPPALSVSMTGAIETGGGAIDYTITVANNSTSDVPSAYVAGSVPAGAALDKALKTPDGATFMGAQIGNAAWLSSAIKAGAKQDFSYTVKVTKAPPGDARAFVHWLAPTEGTAQSSDITWASAIDQGGPRRGCQACHVLADKQTGKYTLAFEAHERVEVDFPGQEHPTVSPSGVSIKPTDQTGPAPCLECHAPGKGDRVGKGNVAPIMLRDIVHPAHLFSTAFKEHYNGTCFTCHNVRGDGTFELLGDKVTTNEKGVPETLLQGTGKIPGEILPSEGR